MTSAIGLRSLLTGVALLATLASSGQQVMHFEYFIDSLIPGQGTTVTVTPSDTVETSFIINTAALLPGRHLIIIRAYDTSGIVSHYLMRWIHVKPPPVGNAAINAWEWFANVDPGVGNGAVSSVSPTDTFVATVPLATDTFAVGANRMYVRVQADNGTWSSYLRTEARIDSPSVGHVPISAWEWFANVDPGVGNGAVSSVSPTDTFVAIVPLATDTFVVGANRVHVRVQADNGTWSTYLRNEARIDKMAPNLKVTDMEYFIGADPGVGSANHISVAPADTIDEDVVAQTDTVALGSYVLSIRAKNETSKWSHAIRQPFSVCTMFGPKSQFEAHVSRNKVTFENSSEYTQQHEWSFGDGVTDSVQVNPVRSYIPGVYDVCLISKNICGNDTLCKVVIVPGLNRMFPTVHSNEDMCFSDVYGAQQEVGSTIRLFMDGGPDIVARRENFVDHTHIMPVFAFNGELPGVYHLEVTHPGGSKDTLLNAITLELSTGHDLWVDLPGRGRILVNRTYSYSFLVGNSGNQTAFGVPLYIKAYPGTIITAKNIKYQDSIPQWVRDSVPDFSYWEDPYTGDTSEFGIFMLSWVRPGEVVAVDVTIRYSSTGSKPLEYYLIPPQYQYWELDSLIRGGCGMSPCVRCALDILSAVPIIGCGAGAAGLLCDIAGGGAGPTWGFALSIAGTLASCTPTPAGLLLSLAKTAASGASALAGAGGSGGGSSGSCAPGGCNPKPKDNKPLSAVGSLDPNIKVGPMGFSAENYIRGDDPIVYGVYFENADTATAPANEVLIVDTLDKEVFNLSSLRFVGFGFGDTTVSVLSERVQPFFVSDVDLRPIRQTIVRVRGELDTVSGALSVYFASLDPDTMRLVSDPLDGFLPPNVNGPEGEGHVQFMLNLKSGIQHLDVIENEASIIFDANDPIVTPVWVNTIDLQAPQSAVDPLSPEIQDTIIDLTWTGTDAHAGIMDYDIHVIEDDTIEYVWRAGVNNASAMFTGEYGITYKFYSVARDLAGNEELPPTDPVSNPDAVTTLLHPDAIVDLSNPGYWMRAYPNPADHALTLDANLPAMGAAVITVNNLAGEVMYREQLSGRSNERIYRSLPVSGWRNGIYIIRLECDNVSLHSTVAVLR